MALGSLYLPTDPAPGFGGLLLAGLVGAFAPRLDDEARDDLDRLLDDVEMGRRIIQPRVRHRFQKDVHGLDRSRHKLIGEGEHLSFDVDPHGMPLPQMLAAVYAAGMLTRAARPAVFRLLRRATRWHGEADERLINFLTNDRPRSLESGAEGWALRVLGFAASAEPSATEIIRRFRKLVRAAHPDHGADAVEAGQRMVDLTEAKRILLSVG